VWLRRINRTTSVYGSAAGFHSPPGKRVSFWKTSSVNSVWPASASVNRLRKKTPQHQAGYWQALWLRHGLCINAINKSQQLRKKCLILLRLFTWAVVGECKHFRGTKGGAELLNPKHWLVLKFLFISCDCGHDMLLCGGGYPELCIITLELMPEKLQHQ